MGVRTARRTSAAAAEPLADVLSSGDDEPRARPGRAERRAVALVLAVGVAVAVPASLSRTAPDDGASVRLGLRDEAVALLRRDGPPVWDLVHGGVRVEVVNEGRTVVRLVAAALSPGQWHVALADEPGGHADPGGRGRLLHPGWFAGLVLHRSVECTSAADPGPTPTRLVLEVEVGGRTLTRPLDVSRAYGGGLEDVLGFRERFCTPVGGHAAPGTFGDPGPPFLELWPGGLGVVRSP